MKSTGIVRKVDELGRITLPVEVRNHLGIMEEDAMEIMYDEGGIYLKCYDAKHCAFCTKKEKLIRHSLTGKYICSECFVQVKKEVSENIADTSAGK
ncbi:MAG: AbrB/MazE/SpoVT family DNA-binding domain-containing protein [Lacrimispora sp.]